MRVGFSVFKTTKSTWDASSPLNVARKVVRLEVITFLIVLCGCQVENKPAPTQAEADSSVEKMTVSHPDVKTYDGLTVEQWRARMKLLGPNLPGGSEAVPGLRQIAADVTVDPMDRRQAAIMIGRLGRPGLEALPTLKALLREDENADNTPAAWAAKAIALLGPAAKEATPELIARLKISTASLESRLACLEALARIGGSHADVIPAILDQLKSRSAKLDVHPQLEVSRGAVDAVALIGPDASIAVPVLMDYLDDSDDLLRTKVVKALGAIGPSASPASSAVAEKLVFDDAEEVRREAALALAQLGSEGPRLLAGLARDEETLVREFSVIALGQNALLSEQALSALTNALDDENERVRLAAAQSLLERPSQRELVVSTLIDLLIHSDRKTRREAADLWVIMKPDVTEWSRLERMMESTTDEYSRRLWNDLLKSRP